MSVDLDPALLEILACPQCHSNVSIDYETGEIVCVGVTCGLAYPIRDNIPIMLVEEAHPTFGQTGPVSGVTAADERPAGDTATPVARTAPPAPGSPQASG
jgi:uncharacterized protein YbaR (Trm112 family)